MPKFKSGAAEEFKQFKLKSSELPVIPHDMQYPFGVIYKEKKSFEVMVLWAQSLKLKREWIEAFNYIKADFDEREHG